MSDILRIVRTKIQESGPMVLGDMEMSLSTIPTKLTFKNSDGVIEVVDITQRIEGSNNLVGFLARFIDETDLYSTRYDLALPLCYLTFGDLYPLLRKGAQSVITKVNSDENGVCTITWGSGDSKAYFSTEECGLLSNTEDCVPVLVKELEHVIISEAKSEIIGAIPVMCYSGSSRGVWEECRQLYRERELDVRRIAPILLKNLTACRKAIEPFWWVPMCELTNSVLSKLDIVSGNVEYVSKVILGTYKLYKIQGFYLLVTETGAMFSTCTNLAILDDILDTALADCNLSTDETVAVIDCVEKHMRRCGAETVREVLFEVDKLFKLSGGKGLKDIEHVLSVQTII